ncbi:uncharacterized protein [Lepeophtheirus salmonis]|uniref:uncharacterized protein n=1 Tax=Lepeophtheirus salmonis TaxID=72036 RepID=UPI001AE4CC94|nr:alpha,alpha-trehalose-phosphate synthase [UDP-forming]-like [Lepeophtheirus salmonis]XP_040581787.1 alpha,alpha-trehalose-phosphate synthase [UDP-forming]-like [Lepeophtheirus salmonis]XP_040581788.1 alpha,alpha-trehalose-phosphate synthase [UDP-forming]-like [Lepeophtheirus salmonis]XP_040581789.1 alpha,alpha-trehalose-phosphate synthase [UDP-forming]-like [Lepeophtheirus salmonis]
MVITTKNLVVVSYRLPFVLEKNKETGELVRKASAGGLVTAVAPVVARSNGKWVGWPGHEYNEGITIPESSPSDKNPTADLKSNQIVPVKIEKEDHDLYYNGCCNGTLWPLFHSMPDKAIFEEDSWEGYKKVNGFFAQATLKVLRDILNESPDANPLIWIHDYQLMLAACTIREVCEIEKLRCKLAFFLHIPFPPWDLVNIFPWADSILQGMMSCDLIGFHTEDYVLNFMDCIQRGLGCRIDKSELLAEHYNRTVSILPLPIGIPFKIFNDLAKEAPPNKMDNDARIILGVDRLDYTKGLANRLLAFDRLLEKFPEYVGEVVLLQIAVPSRTDIKEYQDLKDLLDKLVGQINGKYSTTTWSPIRYIYGSVSQIELAGYYRDAEVGLITPLRDGMNLVAKEFVACRVDKPGVLILSPFAGAGKYMHEALTANPYEIGQLANVIDRALSMPIEDREVRMAALRNRERINDTENWLKMFLQSIGKITYDDPSRVQIPSVDRKMTPYAESDFNFLADYLVPNKTICLLLDYDGTLTPIVSHPDLAVIPPETKAILERLSHRKDVFIAIISGRSVSNAKKMVGLEGITYAGNHGLEISYPDGSQFTVPMPDDQVERTAKLIKALQDEVCSEGAWVENKGVLLTFHYRETPVELREKMVTNARKLIASHGFKVGESHCALEGKPKVKWNKGRAALHILRVTFGVNWTEYARIIFAGDDVTDEDAIVALKGLSKTFRIVSHNMTATNADIRLPSQDSVVTLLRYIERHITSRDSQ